MSGEERQPLLSHSSSSVRNSNQITWTNSFRSSTIILDQREKWKKKISCAAVLLTEILERVAFYSLAGNLVLFLNKSPFSWQSYSAGNAVFIFLGISHLASPIGGYIADSCLGRFWTISGSILIYIVGYAFMPLLAKPDFTVTMCNVNWWHIFSPSSSEDDVHVDDHGKACGWLVYSVLVVIALASGGVKSNMAPFGADQVMSDGPIVMRSFFNWFYWCVNIGALTALGGIVYIQVDPMTPEHTGFYLGYLIPCCCLGVALICFTAVYPFYICKPPTGSVIGNVFGILHEGFSSRRARVKRLNSQTIDYGQTAPPLANEVHESLNKEQSSSWLHGAKLKYGGSYDDAIVEDVESLGNILCIFVAFIPYWMVYFQMETTYLMQGLHMRLDPHYIQLSEAAVFQIPAAWLTLFDVIFLIMLIPLLSQVIYPMLDKRGLSFPLMFRIIIGMFFASMSMIAAGALETYRLDIFHSGGNITQIIGGDLYDAANVSIWWQIPQYSLIGVSEAFATVAGLELAYSAAPRSMQSILMGLFWLFTGLGSILGTGFLSLMKAVVPSWFPRGDFGNLNNAHLDYYFFILGSLQLICLLVFAPFAYNIWHAIQQRKLREAKNLLSSDSSNPPERVPGNLQRRDSAQSYSRSVSSLD